MVEDRIYDIDGVVVREWGEPGAPELGALVADWLAGHT